jgi:hypothetical protein
MPNIINLLWPTLSLIIPAGNSRKIRLKNQADVTKPTKIPEGSRSLAIIGRKLLDKLMPVINAVPMKRSSQYTSGRPSGDRRFLALLVTPDKGSPNVGGMSLYSI